MYVLVYAFVCADMFAHMFSYTTFTIKRTHTVHQHAAHAATFAHEAKISEELKVDPLKVK